MITACGGADRPASKLVAAFAPVLVNEFLACKIPVEVGYEQVDNAPIFRFDRAGRMGRNQDIGHVPQRVVRWERLGLEDIENRSRYPLLAQHSDQLRLIDQSAATDIDEHRVRAKALPAPPVRSCDASRW